VTSTTLDADDAESGIFARWADFGDWQAIAVERPIETQQSVNLSFSAPEVPNRRQRGRRGSKDSPLKAVPGCEVPKDLKRKAAELA